MKGFVAKMKRRRSGMLDIKKAAYMVVGFAAAGLWFMRNSPEEITWYCASVFVINGQRKLFHVPRIFRIATTDMMGRESGNTMCQYNLR